MSRPLGSGRPFSADRLFRILLLVTTVGRLGWIALPGLKYEEAYYWNYSQHPELSYFDHPPMVAWLIGMATAHGEMTEFWVRLPAVLLGIASLILVYRMGQEMFGDLVGLYAAVLMTVLPIFAIFSSLIFPDSPLLFFWCLGLFCGWRLVSTGNANWWWGVGVATGLGLLSKYPAALLPAAPLLHLAFKRRWRLAFAPQMFGAAALALAIFSPVLVWNAQHEWVSILYQGGSRMGEATGLKESLGSWLFQIGVLGITGFFAMVWAVFAGIRRWREPRFLYLLCASLPFLALMVFVSTRRLVQLNWPMPGYVGAILLLAALWSEFPMTRWRKVVTAVLVLIPFWLSLVAMAWVAGGVEIPSLNKADDFNGWRKMGERMGELRASMPRPERTFLVGHGYQAASEVAFYTGLAHLTLSNNAFGDEAKGYDYWERPSDFVGWDAVVMVYEEPKSGGGWRPRTELAPSRLQEHFARVEGPDSLTVFRGGKPLRRYTFWRGFDYRGP